MGNSGGIETKTMQEVFQGYQLMGVEENQRFGDISLYKDKSTGEVVWVKEIPIDEKSTEEILDKYILSQAWKDQVFITKDVYKVAPQEGFLCSANCHIAPKYIVIMEYFERDLEYEIHQRAAELDKNYFPEPEIWYIIESIMSVESVVLRQNRFHGDLRTSSIFISEEGQTKYWDPTILDHKTNSYIKVMTHQSRCNLSPEYFQSLQANQKEPKSNPELTDVFAMGIIILSLATLHDDNWYYDWNMRDILWSNVNDSISELRLRYSPLLITLVEGCLKQRVAERLHLGEVLNYVEQRKSNSSQIH